MSMTDPIADFLTRIRNGLEADFEYVDMPASKFKAELARILREQGYIEDYATESARGRRDAARAPEVHRGPRARDHRPAARVPPGRREYVAAGQVPKVFGGMGTAIISTSKGVMTGHEARHAGRRRRSRRIRLVSGR